MTAAEVYLWGTRIGVVVFDDGIGRFEYDKRFLSSGIEVSPLVMPLSSQVYSFPELSRISFHGLPGLLADSLPDKFGNAVIDAWLMSQGRSRESFDPVERLCYTGNRGMGALEFVPAIGPAAAESRSIEVDRLVKLAGDILADREKMHVHASDDAIQEIIRVGTSAGGARAKVIVAWNEETGDFRSGQVDAGEGYGYWLIKFDGVNGNGDKEGADAPQYTRIEYAYSLMARAAGIDMEECRIYKEHGRHHFMTRRFDRDPLTGAKLHMQSLGGIAHFDFNLPGAYSYEQAAEMMRRMGITRAEVVQLYARMVFNVAARNQDDHVKNISFLMDRSGKWKLSPAYDVTYAYNPDGMWTGSHQMTINGKRERIRREDLLACAGHMGISRAMAVKMIDRVDSAIAGWSGFAAEAELSEPVMEAIRRQFADVKQ